MSIKSATMVHHNPIYTIYSDGRIFNTKSCKWVKTSIYTYKDKKYRRSVFSYRNKSNEKTVGVLARALLCYFVSEQEYFDPLLTADHLDQDSLNNDLSNLRWATDLQQVLNRGMLATNTSGFTGIIYDKARNKWKAQIKLNQKHRNIGRFDNKYDAVIAYRKKHAEIFGVDSQYYPNNFKIKKSEFSIKKLA